eukprot:957696-Amphidinium_carterae.1
MGQWLSSARFLGDPHATGHRPCGGFAQCRWAKLKLPCQGFPSSSRQTVLRRIFGGRSTPRGLCLTLDGFGIKAA